jgi:hypothetical protein
LVVPLITAETCLIVLACRSVLNVLMSGMPPPTADVDVPLGRQVEQLGAVLRHHDLVRGDDVFARTDRALQVAAHRLVATGDLQHDVDRGVLEDFGRVDCQEAGCDLDGPRLVQVADQHPLKAELDACPA